MLRRLKNRERGFTLIELLIVVAIIGIIAALLVPNFIDALQKAKQKRTVADERDWGVAAMSWLTDELGAAAAGASATVNLGGWDGEEDFAAISEVLTTRYIQIMPELDGWKQSFAYRLDTADPLNSRVMLVWSGGRDGDGTMPGDIPGGPFDPTDYDQDIAWADGFFLQWPQRTSSAGN